MKRSHRIMNSESAMLPRLQAWRPYPGPMATQLNWIQRAMRRAKHVLRRVSF